MKKKLIKAVDMVRKIRDKHYEQLKDKPLTEQVKFYRKKAESVNEQFLQKKIK